MESERRAARTRGRGLAANKLTIAFWSSPQRTALDSQALGEALKLNGNLRQLHLGQNDIGDEGGKAWFVTVCHCVLEVICFPFFFVFQSPGVG